MVKYILCCEGIGVRTLASARVLAELESDGLLQSSSSKDAEGRAPFDLLAGVGQGAVLALALASTEVTCKQIQQKMASKANLAQVMDVSPWRRNIGLVSDEPLYSGEGKRDFYRQLFPPSTLLRDITKPVIVLAYDLTTRRVVTFSSELPDSKPAKGVVSDAIFNPPLCDLADAVSASPIYYPPVALSFAAEEGWFRGKNKSSRAPHYFVDGSVACRSPVLAAVAHAKKAWPKESLVVVSIGSGVSTRVIDPTKQEMGGKAWLQHDLVNLVMEGDSGLEMQLAALCGDDVTLIRIDGPLSPHASEDYDDISPANVAAIEEAAKQWYADKRYILHSTLPGGRPESVPSIQTVQAASPSPIVSKLPPIEKPNGVETVSEKSPNVRTASTASSKRSKQDDDKSEDRVDAVSKEVKKKAPTKKGEKATPPPPPPPKPETEEDEEDEDDDGEEEEAPSGSNCRVM